MLSSNLTKLILLAFLLAIPVAYTLADHWLNDFAYRIDISTSPFLLSFLITFTLALATVSHQALRATSINPVRNLRRE